MVCVTHLHRDSTYPDFIKATHPTQMEPVASAVRLGARIRLETEMAVSEMREVMTRATAMAMAMAGKQACYR
jgi:hypothetical protein